MNTLTFTLRTSPEQTLAAIESAMTIRYKKLDIERTGSSITQTKKVLWQKQAATFTVEGGKLVASVNLLDAYPRLLKLLGDIDEAIDDRGWDKATADYGKLSVDSIDKLSTLGMLHDDEMVQAVTPGRSSGKAQLVTVTNQRILLKEQGLSSSNVTSILLDKISAVSADQHGVFGKVRFATSNGEIEVDNIKDQKASYISRSVQGLLGSTKSGAVNQGGVGVADLTKLAELHALGVLTDEEFAAAKAKALGL